MEFIYKVTDKIERQSFYIGHSKKLLPRDTQDVSLIEGPNIDILYFVESSARCGINVTLIDICKAGNALAEVKKWIDLFKNAEDNRIYESVRIYKITNPIIKKIYIGSTKKTIIDRFKSHVFDYYKFCYHQRKSYLSSFEILKSGPAEIEQIEEIDCTNLELIELETDHILRNIMKTVNISHPLKQYFKLSHLTLPIAKALYIAFFPIESTE